MSLTNLESELKLSELKTWLEPSKWQATYEAALSKRQTGTASWIMQCAHYQQWQCRQTPKLNPVSTAGAIPDRILVLQGEFHVDRPINNHCINPATAKPGYGKTIIAATIIERCIDDLSKHHVRNSSHSGVTKTHSSPVLFYFFEKQAQLEANSSSAFRAITTQMLHIYQGDHGVIDAALFLRHKQNSGQLTSTDAEVRSLLKFYLHQWPDSIMIFDGVDECSDHATFLRQLDELASGSQCRILLTCRPTIGIGNCFNHFEKRTLLLRDDDNLPDIESYVRPEIQRLISERKLSRVNTLEDTVAKICARSRSMFLWATLMISYLDSDFLSCEDRSEAIAELNTFEDLDSLYLRILQNLRKQCRAGSLWGNVQRLFQWVTMSRRPLQVNELWMAMAIDFEKPVSAQRLLPEFEVTLNKMSGALMEIAPDNTVRFIHLSVLEFLLGTTDTSDGRELKTKSPLIIEADAADCVIAMSCISYLLHTMPKRPLSGSAQMKADTKDVLKTYPLSLYATQFWAVHASETLRVMGGYQTLTKRRQNLLTSVLSLISNKNAVTCWTEASWTFGFAPAVHDLPTHGGEMMVTFARDLARLTEQWGPTLLNAPNEIWEPSIPAFMKSRFWIGTDAARVVVLGADIDSRPTDFGADVHYEPLTAASQTSSDGSHVGIIKVWTSR
jgi:hypothetical protein